MAVLEYVIRTVGERTEEVCIELVNREKHENELLHVLRENTHARAVECTIAIGQKSKADWLIAIDADMLLIPGSLQSLRQELKLYSSDVSIIHPAVADKLYRMKRWGLTVYRQSILDELNDEFQEIRKQQHLKIEGAAIKALSNKENRQVFFSRNVAAIHDFYQYYRDLYRKAYLNTLRNPANSNKIEKCWMNLSHKDDDYLVMSKAMQDAKKNTKVLSNSIADFDEDELNSVVQSLGLDEKSPLSWDEYREHYSTEVMAADIRKLDKHRIFNDFFEDTSLPTRLRAFVHKIRNS